MLNSDLNSDSAARTAAYHFDMCFILLFFLRSGIIFFSLLHPINYEIINLHIKISSVFSFHG